METDVRRRHGPATDFRHDARCYAGDDSGRAGAVVGAGEWSGTRPVPAEIPPYVFLSLFCCFAVIMAAFFILFRGRPDAIFMVVVSAGYLLIYTALPLLMLRFETRVQWSFATFLRARIAIFGGTLSGRDAWIQICLIPFMLMMATLGICVVVATLRP